MNLPTRYEVAYEDTDGNRWPLGFIARKSGTGLLAFIQSSKAAQAVVEFLPEGITVQRKGPSWLISLEDAPLGSFRFTGRTQRDAQQDSERTFLGARGVTA